MEECVGKNTLYLTAASIGQKILAFVYFLFLARVLGTEQTGEYFLALSITTIFSTITDFGVTSVVVRDVAKYPEKATSLIRHAFWLKIPFMFLGVFGSMMTAWMLGYEPIILVLVAFASLVMLADAVSLLFYGILRGHHILKYESLGIFVGQCLTLVIGCSVLAIRPSVTHLIAALLFGSLFNALFSLSRVISIHGAKILCPNIQMADLRKLFLATLPFAFAGIFVKTYSYIDSILISKMIGTEAVGIYAVAYKFTYAFQFLPMALVAALYPGMSALVGRDTNRLRRLFDDSIWYVTALSAPIVFGLFAIAPDAIALAGDEYAGAVPVLQILIFVLIPIFLDFPVGSLLNAADRQSTKTTIMGLTVLLNVFLNVLLIPRFGIMGAGIAALASFTFLSIGGLYFVPRIIKGYSYVTLGRIISPILLSGLVMGVSAFLLRPIIGFVLTIPVAAVIYIAMLVITRSLRVDQLRVALDLIRRKPSYAENTSIHD